MTLQENLLILALKQGLILDRNLWRSSFSAVIEINLTCMPQTIGTVWPFDNVVVCLRLLWNGVVRILRKFVLSLGRKEA